MITPKAVFWGIGGQCSWCETPSPTAAMFNVGPTLDAFFVCEQCVRGLAHDLSGFYTGLAFTEWHDATPAPANVIPNDGTTVLGFRRGWPNVRPVQYRRGFWHDVENRNTVLMDHATDPQGRPPQWWARMPGKPERTPRPCDGKPCDGEGAAQ